MLALMTFDTVTLDNRTMTVAIVTNEEEMLLAEIGWEEKSFYLNKGYSLEEARRLRCGLLIEKMRTLILLLRSLSTLEKWWLKIQSLQTTLRNSIENLKH